MSNWILEPVPQLRGYTVEWAEPGRLLVSKRNGLYSAKDVDSPMEELGAAPAPFWRETACRSRIIARLFRFRFYNVVPIPKGGLFCVFAREMVVLRSGEFQLIGGLPRACRTLRSGCAVQPDGTIFFGEYYLNNDRQGAVHLFAVRPGETHVQIVHRFEPGEVRHVHGVFRDPYENCLWCTTGDKGHECRLLRTSDQFATIETVGAGDETWRCVNLCFTPDAVYYGTDAEFQTNHIYRVDRRTGRRDALTQVQGPIYYAHAVGRDLFFGVSVEFCPSQQDDKAWLWHVSPQDECKTVKGFKKDVLPWRYFLPGSIYFPSGPGCDKLSFVHTIALSGVDGCTFMLKKHSG